MSVGNTGGIRQNMITYIWKDTRRRRENVIDKEREDSDDKEEIEKSEWTTVDQAKVQVMSLSDEDDEETKYEEDIPDPSDFPDLSDSENSDDSDQDGMADDHNLG